MSYSQDREWFVAFMSRNLRVDLSTLRRMLRDAGIIQRAAEVDCSVSNEAVRAQAEMDARRAAAHLRSVVDGVRLGLIVTVDGDPRGYCCSIYAPGQDRDTEEPFVRIPAQGYRASQMARMTR